MKKAFTLVEMIIIISIMGILSVGIASFLSENERTKMLQAESCMNEMNSSIKNFTNAAMTSKQLRLNNNTDAVFPDYYIIEFQPKDQTISFKYEIESPFRTGEYQKINLKECKKEKIEFTFASGSVTNTVTVRMNSGFRQLKPNELFTFSLFSGTQRAFTGEIAVDVYLDDTYTKEFFKWIVDTRSQGIFTRKCLFYSETDPQKCETREGTAATN